MHREHVRGALLAMVASVVTGAAHVHTAHAHEFWIAPRDFTPMAGESLAAELHNGQDFAGQALTYQSSRHPRTTIRSAAGERPWRGGDGDPLAFDEPATAGGLHVLALQSTATPTVHETFAEFAGFVTEEGAADIAARHRDAGLPERRILELFSRHAKALVAVDGEGGVDRPLGLALEIVALDDPYARPRHDDASNDAASLSFRLLFDGQGLANTQVSIFHKGEHEAMAEERLVTRSDATGRFSIDASREGYYLLSAVLLRRPTPSRMLESGALWESLWASLTFAREP